MGYDGILTVVNVNSTDRTDVMKFISDRELETYELINFFIITSVISLCGVVGNVMNIIVFYKQGFDNSINISFFGLAVSDLCSLLTLLWFGLCMSPLLVQADWNLSPLEMRYLTGGHPHICFARITSWITVFITVERTLCITLPLKIKRLITTRRTTVIICAIYTLIMLSFEPEYHTSYYGLKFDLKRNKTLLGLIFRSSRKDLEGLAFFLYAILGFASFIIVIIFTLVLVIQLNKKSKWRMKANVEKVRSETVSNRERKTMTMVVMIATVLIVCYAPGVAVSTISFFESGFVILGNYENEFLALWSFVFVFEAINSSVNIMLYYHMSTKYRDTFHAVFGFIKSTAAS